MAYGSHQVTALSVRKLSKIAHSRPIAGMGGSGRSGRGDVAGVADARVDLISIPSTTANASLFDLRLIAKNHVQQGTLGFNVAIVINKPQFSKFAHENLTRDRVVPIISASVSWLIFAITGSGHPSLSKFAGVIKRSSGTSRP
jgi:hypothetical protein